MIGVVLAAAVVAGAAAPAPAQSVPTFASVGWSADGGVPVDLGDGAVLYLFGDTVMPGSFVHNSAVIVWQDVTLPLWAPTGLLRDGADSWFWPADAVANADGSLTVVANEVRHDASSWFGFAAFDTDVFVVADPYSVASWRFAEHVDVGPWDGLNVSFLDAARAVVRPFGSTTTYLADLTTADWARTELFAESGGAGGTFVPVDVDGVWFGLTWDMASGAVALWRDGGGGGGWEQVDEWAAEAGSYGHQLHVVDGRVVYVYSPPGDGYELGRSTTFPRYSDVTEVLS